MNESASEILRNLTALCGEQDGWEVRILDTPRGVVSGLYTDLEQLADDVAEYDGQHQLFITLNPIKPDILAGAANKLAPAKRTTRDNEVERRRWFMIDIDPVRPANVSATDEEKEAARQLAARIRHRLERRFGFPEPLVADSGNGFHILYRIDLPNDDASRDLLRKVLQALDLLFSDDRAKVDTTTYNAARIVKMYGSIACKGDDTPERPHRRSRIISCPEELVEVPVEDLELVANLLPQDPEPSGGKSKGKGQGHPMDVDRYLADHNVEVASKAQWNGGTRWVLRSCPWNPEHKNLSAYVVQLPNGAVGAGCHHNSCSQQNWHTLRDKLQPGWRERQESDGGEADEESETQTETLIRLAEPAELIHTPTDEAYAVVPLGTHRLALRVRGRDFKRWLTRQYYGETGKTANSNAMNQAIDLLESRAMFDGEERRLFLRVAGHNGKFYYDLADRDGRVIEVDPNGWRVAGSPPAIFRRTKNMIAQVLPSEHGDLKHLTRHVRAKSEEDEILFLVALVTAFVPGIAHPVMVAAGEKGAAKTTTMRMVRRVVDPAAIDLYVLPKSEQELALVLSSNYAPSFDNVESISAKQSDMLCMASTGGGISKRTLYTDDEETILQFKHCVGLNGINVVATRPDLLDRSVIHELERVPKKERKEEQAVWDAFDADLPRILGGAFSVLSGAMRIYPTVTIDELPRMADFARWGYAAAEAMGIGGESFLKAYTKNMSRANDNAINEHPVAAAVVAFMQEHETWEGQVAQLLSSLETIAVKQRISVSHKLWPRGAHVLSRRLNEIKSNLAEIGITFSFRHHTGGTLITLVGGTKKGFGSLAKSQPALPIRPGEESQEDEFAL